VSLINVADKEIQLKIVYYGPGLCGKTTSLEFIHRNIAEDKRPELVSLDTEEDRTLFFDFLPIPGILVISKSCNISLKCPHPYALLC